MADLFKKQRKKYSDNRPGYPDEPFRFIASKTPKNDLAWDVGTDSGQAAVSLSKIYKNVIATDASEQQLAHAHKLPNIHYRHTPTTMSPADLARALSPEPHAVDVVTVAQALHWFGLPAFYAQVNHVLRRPGGVFAAWCYTLPLVDPPVDSVFNRYYATSGPYWDAARRLVEEEYRTVALEEEDHTGPFEFTSMVEMGLDGFLDYLRSSSRYQTAKDQGVELLGEEVVAEFEAAWGGEGTKVVRFPVFLRIGRVVE
ncbi:hypothetical protein QJS04_geneDACA024386 [Acorus gramineus]|uniref:Methyltransferase type 11 domain-containing protein n=1 Tax=Acorus gramineus TaxID=55184 RepID=A0AAV9A0M9_ACOGR|nr:hypothetical protein QJS04_geneDACA024386 [Acorus gramineus]